MELLEGLRLRLRQWEQSDLLRTRRIVQGKCCAQLSVGSAEDPRLLNAFCSNDYLGLAAHPAVVAALVQGARQMGVGAGASHLISGHHQAHERLEAQLADLLSPHIPQCRALLFASGYLANIGVLATLADRQCEIFSEELNHASLIDGIRLSGANRRVYPHADLASLDAMLRASSAASKIIVTDAVFSMDGDLAPLGSLLELARRHGAWLFVDDAHGFGVLGERGRGSLSHHGLRSEQLIYMGTLGKALGVAGAFVAAHQTLIEFLVQRARPYVFSTASPAALAVALEAALQIATGAQGDELRVALRRNITRLREALHVEPWRLLASDTAIQPIVIGENARTMQVADALLGQGFWVAGIRPPTVPPHTARLRVALSAVHSVEQIDQLAEALNVLAAQHSGT